MPQQPSDTPSKATVWLVNYRFGKDGNVTAFADREGALKEVRTIVAKNYDDADHEEIAQLSEVDNLTEENNTILQEAEDKLADDFKTGDLSITLDGGDIHIKRVVLIASRRQEDLREEGEGS